MFGGLFLLKRVCVYSGGTPMMYAQYVPIMTSYGEVKIVVVQSLEEWL
jgi:hypothetical protein